MAYFDHGNHTKTNYQSEIFLQIWGERWDLKGQITLKICDIWSLEWTQNMFWASLSHTNWVGAWRRKNLRTKTTTNLLTLPPPLRFDCGQRFNGFFKASLILCLVSNVTISVTNFSIKIYSFWCSSRVSVTMLLVRCYNKCNIVQCSL